MGLGFALRSGGEVRRFVSVLGDPWPSSGEGVARFNPTKDISSSNLKF
jgi:hypothetical protein